MPRGRHRLSMRCAGPSCDETRDRELPTVAEYYQAVADNKADPWKCTRHARPDEWLRPGNETAGITLVARRVPSRVRDRSAPEGWRDDGYLSGLFWWAEGAERATSGYLSGPGFTALADEFPEGTRLEVTARILPPETEAVMGDPCALWADEPGVPLHGGPCGEETVCVIRSGCVHEHLTEQRACPGCALDVQKAAGALLCGRCLMAGPGPHECLFLVVMDWDEGYRDPESLTVVQRGRFGDRVDPWRRRAEVVKVAPGEDLYVAWTYQAEEPQWMGSRAEALAAGCPEDRLRRADATGSSYFPGEPGWFFGDREGNIAEQRGTLARDRLAAYVTAWMEDRLTEAYQMLEPFDD